MIDYLSNDFSKRFKCGWSNIEFVDVTMISVNDVEKIILKHKVEIMSNYKVQEIGVFGSYVRGEQRADSDVDILVEFVPDSKISLLDFIDLENYLSELLNIQVDLVERTALKHRISEYVLNEVVYV